MAAREGIAGAGGKRSGRGSQRGSTSNPTASSRIGDTVAPGSSLNKAWATNVPGPRSVHRGRGFPGRRTLRPTSRDPRSGSCAVAAVDPRTEKNFG